MKKILILMVIFLTGFALTSCSLGEQITSLLEEFGGKEKCDHEYDEGFIKLEPTCTTTGIMEYTCTKCQDTKQETIPKSDHNYINPVSSTATCTQPGTITYTCSNCGDTYIETSGYMPHTFDSYGYDEDEDGYHYKICSVCHTEYEHDKHEFEVSEVTHWDCTHDGVAHLECACGYNFNKVIIGQHNYVETRIEATCVTDGQIKKVCSGCNDEIITIIPKTNEHNYEGHVCLVCQVDEMLQYNNEFQSRGASFLNPINIESENELVCLIDYVIYYNLPETGAKIFELKYTNSDVMNITKEALKKATGANTGINYGMISSGGKRYGKIYSISSVTDPTIKHGVGYIDKYVPQAKLANIYIKPSTRTSLSVLPYESRENLLEVSNTNQLFYALSHGYKPVVTSGSSAERIFNKALEISRSICDDTMSEVEKIIAIYDWIVNNVSYDSGAVTASNNKTIDWEKCNAWYLEGVFDDGLAVCDGISKAFSVLCGIENIICIQPSGSAHAWNKVYVDANNDGVKEWYIVDSTFANAIGKNHETYLIQYLFFTDSEREAQGYIAQSHTECIADTVVNPYKLIHYNNNMTAYYDLYIESESELRALFLDAKAKNNATTEDLYVSFMIGNNYTGSSWTTVYSSVFGGGTISYSQTDNLYESGNTAYVVILK